MKTWTSQTSGDIVKRSGSNLAFALPVLPREKRDDMKVFYAFCRVIDDIADQPEAPGQDRNLALEHWRNLIEDHRSVLLSPGVETELVELIGKYQLDRDLLVKIIDGVAMDLDPTLRFATRHDLQEYCFRVASAVGLISIEIFGYRNPQTKQYAEALGYALQWTNILRDIGEDAAESRIYLPLEVLDEFEVTEMDILTGRVPVVGFQNLMTHEAETAKRFYREAIQHLVEEDRSAMRSPELMRRIYQGILKKMERDKFRVFEKRYRLSKARMLSEFLWAKFGPQI